MEKSYPAWKGKAMGDTAVDGLTAGVVAGLAMAFFMIVTALLTDASPARVLGYFDPARAGNWLTGLLAHLAVSAIYGLVFALLLRALAWMRPVLGRLAWLWGIGYGLGLLGLAYGVLFAAADSHLTQLPVWQFSLAHVVYGLGLGLRTVRGQQAD